MKVINTHQFLLIVLHFTIIYTLEVTDIYCICMTAILYDVAPLCILPSSTFSGGTLEA